MIGVTAPPADTGVPPLPPAPAPRVSTGLLDHIPMPSDPNRHPMAHAAASFDPEGFLDGWNDDDEPWMDPSDEWDESPDVKELNLDDDPNFIKFTVVPSLRDFFLSEKFQSFIIGPYGSTKTTHGMFKILFHASRVKACKDGIRRSKAVWIRNTKQQLVDTSIEEFKQWLPDGLVGDYHKTHYTYVLRYNDVECKVLFRSLDKPSDVSRLLSLQASFFVFEEFREIHQDVYESACGRVGRFPNKKHNGVGCAYDDGTLAKRVWGMSNPPDMDSFWEGLLTDPADNMHVTIQPSGLSPDADWVQYLDHDYYTNLAKKKSQRWIDVYIHAKFGETLSGKPVYPGFSRDLHVHGTEMQVPRDSNNTLLIGVDTGLNPAAVIGEVTPGGRLHVYDATWRADMPANIFARDVLKPLLASRHGWRLAQRNFIIFVDPAGNQRSQSDASTAFDAYRAAGFDGNVKAAATNLLNPRLMASERFISSIDRNGKACLRVCPVHAAPLVSALGGKYRYKVNTLGDKADLPDKNHPHSDLADAFQYICLFADGGNVLARPTQDAALPVRVANAAGWT